MTLISVYSNSFWSFIDLRLFKRSFIEFGNAFLTILLFATILPFGTSIIWSFAYNDSFTWKNLRDIKELTELFLQGYLLLLILYPIHLLILKVASFIRSRNQHTRQLQHALTNNEENIQDIEIEEPNQDLIGFNGSIPKSFALVSAILVYLYVLFNLFLPLPGLVGNLFNALTMNTLKTDRIENFDMLIGLVIILLVAIALYDTSAVFTIARVSVFGVLDFFVINTLVGFVALKFLSQILSPVDTVPLEAMSFEFVQSSHFNIDLISTFSEMPLVHKFSMYWILGITHNLTIKYIATKLRDVYKPGTLWFYRFHDEHNFSYLDYILSESIFRHALRIVKSIAMYTVLTFATSYVPGNIFNCLSIRRVTLSVTNDLFMTFSLIPLIILLASPLKIATGLIAFWANRAAPLFGLDYLLKTSDQETFPGSRTEKLFKILLYGLSGIAYITTIATIGLILPLLAGRFLLSEYLTSVSIDIRNYLVGLTFLVFIYFSISNIISIPIQWKRLLTVLPSIILSVALVPTLFGVLYELVVSPFTTTVSQSHSYFSLIDTFSKGLVISYLMIQDKRFKSRLEALQVDNYSKFNTPNIIRLLLVPVIFAQLLFLTVPYIVAYLILPNYTTLPVWTIIIVQRVIYSCLFFVLVIVISIMRQFTRLGINRKVIDHEIHNFEES